jgi:hypothetical protein
MLSTLILAAYCVPLRVRDVVLSQYAAAYYAAAAYYVLRVLRTEHPWPLCVLQDFDLGSMYADLHVMEGKLKHRVRCTESAAVLYRVPCRTLAWAPCMLTCMP